MVFVLSADARATHKFFSIMFCFGVYQKMYFLNIHDPPFKVKEVFKDLMEDERSSNSPPVNSNPTDKLTDRYKNFKSGSVTDASLRLFQLIRRINYLLIKYSKMILRWIQNCWFTNQYDWLFKTDQIQTDQSTNQSNWLPTYFTLRYFSVMGTSQSRSYLLSGISKV